MPNLMRAARTWRPAAVVLALITALSMSSLAPGAAQAATTPPPAVASASPATAGSGSAQPSTPAAAPAGKQHVSLHAYWPTGGKVRSARQISSFIAGGRSPAQMPGLVAARPTAPGGSTGAAARARSAPAVAAVPNGTIAPGQPAFTVDSSLYQGGHLPADIYQYPSVSTCRNQVINGTNTTGTWTKNRYSTCAVIYWVAQDCILEPCGQPGSIQIGSLTFRVTLIGYGSNIDRTVGFVQNDDQFVASGTLASPTIQASMTCDLTVPGGSCPPAAANGRTDTLAGWQANGAASFTFTSPSGSGLTADNLVHAQASVVYTVTAGSFNATNTVQIPEPFRFDSAVNANGNPIYTGRPGGAVFNEAIPTLTFNAADNTIDESADHIQTALNNPGSTYPVVTPKPIPGGGRSLSDYLTRTTDQTRINSNRSAADAACAQAVSVGFFVAATAGQQCDEFPFATTYEGANFGNLLYSVRYISGTDNQESGNRLNGFYRANRMIDGDEFAVSVYNAAPPVVDVAGGGAFATLWTADGSAGGVLGTPTDAWLAVPGGEEQDFANGAIYWSAATGTHEIDGALVGDYKELGGPESAFGFPAGNSQNAAGGGRESLFGATNCGVSGITGTGSAILSAPGSSVAGAVQGCIYQAYLKLYGGPGSTLGYPTTDEQGIGSGRVSYFTGGTAPPACSTGSEPADGITKAAVYWNGTAHDVTGCIFAEYHSVGEATGELGFPTDDPYAYNGGHQQDFQNGYIFDAGGTATVTLATSGHWVVGHAAHAGNDYPYETIGQFEHQNEGTDAWNEYYGQCDSFAAWKAYENLAGSAVQHPAIVPAPGWTPSNASISPVNQFTWGNADIWATKWKGLGYAVNNVPTPGAIAWWPNAVTDPQDSNPPDPVHGLPGSNTGHVGYVTDVYPDGSITVEMYNMRVNGEYSVVHMAYNQGYTDNSFGHGNYSVPWPGGFIHVADGPASGAASPAEPSSGVVQATYPSQVKVIGPGSSASQFSLGNVWYSNAGFGEIGQEERTHTNGPTALSTATWTPSGLAASTCYEVDALVPNEYSDNPVAVYTVGDVKGTSMAAVNENQTTSDWAELGVYETNTSGGITVKLDDRGTVNLWVAADAMRFWRQASCSGYGDASPIVGPGSLAGSWTTVSGHGFFGSEKYSATHGTTVVDSAAYNPHLIPLDCYEVFAYVPDSHSDNNAATYAIADQWYGNFWPQVNENSFTSQFTDLGMFMARTDGSLPVTLLDLGPAGQYVAADAVAYTLDTNCKGIRESGTGIGSTYQPGQIGPGSPPADFSTTNQWYTQLGHGYANHELWTYDNGSTADSTATWTFHGSAATCYSVSAFIPDNLADNTQAHYQVGSTLEGFGFTFDQATATGWSDLGALTTGSNGIITVTLNDLGPPGDYTAADAMQFDRGGTGC